jgi:transcription elongation factor GreA
MTKITLQALTALQNELYKQLNFERPLAIAEVQDARSNGDLSENMEFTLAQQNLQKVNQRITELQNYIQNAEIIEITGTLTYVTLGATVELYNGANTEIVTFVDKVQADPLNNQFSTDCPLYKAIEGRRKGETLEFRFGNHVETFTILSIQ